MPPFSFKPDASFFQKIAIGALGARAVKADLDHRGHNMMDLENGSTDTKLWKDVKRKRVRIPDLVCVRCGLRVESRAKSSSAKLAMSHSFKEAERAWDFGMVNGDVIAIPVVVRLKEETWARNQLQRSVSYWHNRERVFWQVADHVNYFSVGSLRAVPHGRTATKGAEEASEISIGWDAIFSTRDGRVERVDGHRVCVRRAEDGHAFTWPNRKDLPVMVAVGDEVRTHQLLASAVEPLVGDALACLGSIPAGHIEHLLRSPERTQQFTGVKLARLGEDASYCAEVEAVSQHEAADIYVRLESAAYLVAVCGRSARQLFGPHLVSTDDQIRLEAVVALAEAGTDEAVNILTGILDDPALPYFLRSAAAWALGRIGTNEAVERLIRAFGDVSGEIREEALEEISRLALPPFEQLADAVVGDSLELAAGAAEAIRRRGGAPREVLQRLVEDIAAGREHPWSTWVLGTIPRQDEAVKAALARIQSERPESHFAISVLWSFIQSWIARTWELLPHPDASAYD